MRGRECRPGLELRGLAVGLALAGPLWCGLWIGVRALLRAVGR